MTKLELLILQSRSLGDTSRGITFRAVLRALTENASLDLAHLYDLPYDDFELVIEAFREWRLQRYVYGAVAVDPHPRPVEKQTAVPA